ncbi:MAG: glutamine--fructose-6-phosphate transaminase (isomerizing) [Candidatus Uhrbacteria bacterium]|nr:glutamine--fructose-6-phosphate transaminase (isomerizing) [Candidatus Uhrbacteria bacterium]
MCGIIGAVGDENTVNVLLDGLSILESRGYDSAGIATIDDAGKLHVSKFASTQTSNAINHLREHRDRHINHRVGIGHTRWATHGGKTDQNAHPHTDTKGRIALVHNGVIENANALRTELQKLGITFLSETDTEVIAQLIGRYLDEHEALLPAIKHALTRLEGTWGIAVVATEAPDRIIAARNGSPLVVGIAQGKMYVASEPAAFGNQTREFIALHNGEIAIVKPNGHTLDVSRIEHAPDETIDISPDPHPHWTIKEILEQPEAIARTLNHGARILNDTQVKLGGLEENADRLLGIRHLVIAACGTSFHTGLYGGLAMRALKAFDTVQVVDASELTVHHFPGEHAGLLVISQSGETKDVHRALQMAEDMNVPTFSVVNAVGSLIARSTKCGVYLNAGREHAVASTKAFTTQVAALELIAIWFSQQHKTEEGRRRKAVDELRRLATNIRACLELREDCKRVAHSLLEAQHCFVLGKGTGEPIAREGALKIKEITYLHAEGYPGGALKHGPFALIQPGTPVIMLMLDDTHAQLMRIAAEEVRARGARTIIITDNAMLADGVADETIVIPKGGVLTALLAAVPLQLIAYEMAVAKGINPDRPRNLAKAVTVD